MQATWGDLVFSLDETEGARVLKTISRRTALKIKEQADLIAAGSTVVKGLEPFVLSIAFSTSSAAGADILGLAEKYEAKVGDIDYFMLNGKQFYPKQLQLISVDAQNMSLDLQGRPLTADFILGFKEYTPEKTKKRVNKTPGNNKKQPPAVSAEALNAWRQGFSGASLGPTQSEKDNYARKI